MSWTPRTSISSLLVALALVSALLTHAPRADAADDFEKRAPTADAKPLTAYESTSKGGLRFLWWLPKGYDGKRARNLTVILHGTGLDYRWGGWNNKPGIFRPDDVVVSVDGTSAGEGESRVFLGEQEDAKAFKDLLDELRATFAVERVFLYGHSQGGFFVVYYAGEFPKTVAGVVAHASGAWNWSKMPKDLHDVAISFLHGTGDPVVPYRQSPGSRDAYAKKDFELLHLRRMHRYNHWPNAVRATEELEWCQGMTTSSASEALACALSILRVKKPDEYRWETVVGFSAARDVLRRLAGGGRAPLADVPDDVAKEAKRWIDAIEAHAAEHVAALRKVLPAKGALALDGKPWLGHLVPLREDFRGVDAAEALFQDLGYDKLLAAHEKASKPLFDAWYGSGSDAERATVVFDTLAKCFLLDTLPHDLAEKLDGWQSKAKPSDKGAKKAPDARAWLDGWKDGWKQYENVWRSWKGPDN
jgi:predicted esterase